MAGVYTWAKIGQQKRIEQTQKKGKRLNLCGLLELGQSFEYGLSLKSFQSEGYIKLIDWQESQAEQRLKETGKITVVVQDRGSPHISNHISKFTKANYERWANQGLYIFLLPSYSPQLNHIETEWQRIKEDELAGQMFEDEYELSMAVISTIESRQARDGLVVKRYHFTREKI